MMFPGFPVGPTFTYTWTQATSCSPGAYESASWAPGAVISCGHPLSTNNGASYTAACPGVTGSVQPTWRDGDVQLTTVYDGTVVWDLVHFPEGYGKASVAKEIAVADVPCRQCTRKVSPGDAKCWYCETERPGGG